MSIDDSKPDKLAPARPVAEQTLKQEISQLQHELRRIRDGLERSPSHELEQRARQLAENIALCEHDLQYVSARNATDPKAPLTGEENHSSPRGNSLPGKS